MRKVGLGLAFAVSVFACLLAIAQDSPSTPAQTAVDPKSAQPAPTASAPAQSIEAMPSSALTLNDVLDRVVQREHYFMNHHQVFKPKQHHFGCGCA